MRSGDYATAERAFDQLASSSEPQPRDEARLARAQVWLAEGRVSEARPELAALAASGATPLVRQRAGDELRRITDSTTPQPPGTNSP
jgi:thioredoxin-like negative regulator of GroEL